MTTNGDVRLYRKFVETAKLLTVYLNHFPKHEKYALCTRIKDCAYRLRVDPASSGLTRGYTTWEVHMACPKCKCKVTYFFDDSFDFSCGDDYERERCSACGTIFYSMDAEDEDDYTDLDYENDCRINGGQG